MEHVSIKRTAASATLHCLTGCAIGEVLGLVLGQAFGWPNPETIAVSIVLAFIFGYSLSILPLLRAQITLVTALSLVLAADTLSILTMEAADNLVMATIPGAMNAGLSNAVFWFSMPISLAIAFAVAFPVNLYLLKRGKGHALVHKYHDTEASQHDAHHHHH